MKGMLSRMDQNINLFKGDLFAMFMHSPNWVCICRMQDGIILEINSKFTKGVGANRKDFLGKSIFELDFIVDKFTFRKEIDELRHKKNIPTKIFEVRTKKNIIKKGFLSISVFTIKTQSYFLFTFDDQTAFVKVHEQLLEREQICRGVFENTIAGFYIISSETERLIYCNDYFAKILGFSNAEKTIGVSIYDLFVDPNDSIKVKDIQKSSRFVDELQMRSPSGQPVWVLNYIYKRPQNDLIEGVIIDIAERKRVEKQLIISEYRFRTLIENTSDLIFIINQQGDCSYVSPSIHKVLGYSKNHNPKNILSIIAEKNYDEFIPFLKSLPNNPRNSSHLDILVKHKNGTYRTLAITAKKFLEVAGINGIIINAHDITDIVKAQEEISFALWKEKELNRQRTQFISTVSHDFRTPLTNISLNIQLLERYVQDHQIDYISKNLDRMSNATKRLTALLNEVSLISKEQSGRLAFNPEEYSSSVFIDLLVGQVDYLFQSNVVVDVNKNAEVEVRADQLLITHIVDNLLSNAIKFSPEKEPISFSMKINNNGVFNLIVKDRGIGIPAEELKFLFDPYFRASNVNHISGNGLGLSIVKRCVNLHHGIISITSKETKGTTVKVTIPLNK